MDVTCPRCSTRYEFDAALVSARGTTVKCTSCTHQFKVFRPKDAAGFDGWTIRTVDGRELRYDAMRRLQAAITNGEITRHDVLIPTDGSEPRRLVKIEELQSFFKAAEVDEPTIRRRISAPAIPSQSGLAITKAAGTKSSPKQAVDDDLPPNRTGNTLRPPSQAIPPDPKTIPRGANIPSIPRDRLSSDAPTMAQEDSTSGTTPMSSGRVEVDERDLLEAGFDEVTNAALRRPEPRRPAPQRPTPAQAAPRRRAPSVSDEDTIGEDSALDHHASARPRDDSHYPSDDPILDRDHSLAPLTPSPSAARPSILRRSGIDTEPRFTSYGPAARSRPGLARWVVGIIAVGVLAVGGFALFNRYAAPTTPATSATPASDNRVDDFLAEGDKLLANGDIEGAKDAYLKASALADRDARVARSLARIEIVRADQLWLYVRLLEKGSPHHTSLSQQLKRATARAKSASDKAVEVAPDDPSTVGLRIDVLRLQGKAKEARELVPSLDGTGPDAGRALALLDLLEEEPNYGSVIDRLRTATRTERRLGRAHALLVYVLAKAGRKDDALREIAALRGENPTHSLIAPLSAWAEGAEVPMPEPTATATAKRPPPPVGGTYVPPPGTDDHAEPFETAEPDITDLPPGEHGGPGDDPPPPPEPSDEPPPPEPSDEPPPPEPTDEPPPPPPGPPPVDVSDLPPE
jgi:predicted Zn finger-like uncharacterized protein